MTQATPRDYWFSRSGFHITLNAMSDSNKLQCSVQSGSVIMCFMRGIKGLEYDNGHNYQRWPLMASPTVFHDSAARYVYVAIPRPESSIVTAQVVFPSQYIDIYGCNEAGEQIGNTNYYYIWTQGIIRSNINDKGESVMREWQQDINTGSLATDQAFAEQQQSEWFEYNSITDQVRFLKDIIEGTIINLTSTTAKITTAIVNTLTLAGRNIIGIAVPNADPQIPEDSEEHIVTPAYGKEMYVSRQHDDTKQGSLVIKGNLLQGETGDVEPYIGSESFLDDLLGWGWRAYKGGRITADSMSLRKFLEVPELRFNRTTITTGVTWHTVGAGIIEEVAQGEYAYEDVETHQRKAAHGMVKLKLEDGEVGAVAYNDLAMGIWHNLGDGTTTMNETENRDGHDGNFTFAGFQTIYFRVVALCHKDGAPVVYKADGTILPHYDSEGNDITCRNQQYFLYELREKKEGAHGWQREFHPVSGMHFACYANRTNSERQACSYQTDTYFVLLAGLTDWTYDGTAIQFLFGDRKGFTIPARRWDTGEEYEHQLVGYGAGMGNVVRWGQDEHINRAPSVVSQQLLWLRSALSFDELKAMSFKDIVDIHWHQMSVDIPRPTEDEPYLYHRWLITYDNGHTSDGYADEEFYIERHPELLPWLVEEWMGGVLTLQPQYAAVKRMEQNVFALTDEDGTGTDLYGLDADGDEVEYDQLAELVLQCRRYRNDKPTNGGYLTYHTDLDATKHDYDETGIYGIDSKGEAYDYRGVSVKEAKDSVTFTWYKDDTMTEQLREVTVPVVYDGYSMTVEPDRQMTDLPRNQQLTLTAVVRMGELDITQCYDPECFVWSRISGQSAEEQASDREWEEANKDRLQGHTLVVTDEDMYRRAKFDCAFNDGRSLTLVAGIQLTQIEDGYSCYLDNQGDMMGVGNNKIYDNESGDVEPMEFTSRFHLLCGNDEQDLTDLQVVDITPTTDKLTVVTDTKTGNITITAQPGLDFTHAGNEYKIRFKATCYGLTRGHSDDPTYLSAEFILQGIPEAADGVSYRLSLSRTFIKRDGHGEYVEPNASATVNVIYSKSNGELSVMTEKDMKDLDLSLDYAVDGVTKDSKTQAPPLTVTGIGSSIKPEKAITVRLWHGDKQVDGQDIFVVQDGTNNVRIDLDNENDSMLYNGQGVKASGNITSNISMWDGSTDVTSQATFSIEADGCTATLPTGSTTITVTALSKNNASVKVTGRYRNQDYSTVLTLAKKNNTDKYDLAITPNAIAYNATTQKASSDKITVQIYRTYIDTSGSAKTVLCDTLPTGYSLKEGGSAVTYKGGKYERTPLDYTRGDYRYDLLNKDGGVEDYETIPINKADDGRGETGRTIYYEVSDSNTEAPKFKDKHTSSPATSDTYKYLWKQTTITYNKADKDGETTETFTEMIGTHGTKGVDGDGEDYIYCLAKKKGDTLPTYPTAPLNTNSGTKGQWQDDPLNVDSEWQYEYMAVAHKRDGKWGAYGDLSIYKYYVKDGTSVKAQYSVDGSTNWHDTFAATDIYMRTSTDGGTNWGKAIRIVGEQGGEGDYTDYSFNISKKQTSTNETTAPADCYYSTWQDGPKPTTADYPFLWMKVVKMTWDSTTKKHTAGTAKYARVTGEKGPQGDKPVKGVDYDDGKPGIQGCIIRMRGEWQAGETYVNQSNLKSDGERYIDIVTCGENESQDPVYYKALPKDGNKGIEPGEHSNWSLYWTVSEKQEFIATKVLLADNAAIKMTQGQSLLLQCDESTPHITAGASGGTTKDGKHTGTAFWAGSNATSTSNLDPSKAPFNVDHEGNLNTNKLKATGGTIGDLTISEKGIGISTFGSQSEIYFTRGCLKVGHTESGVSIDPATLFVANWQPTVNIWKHDSSTSSQTALNIDCSGKTYNKAISGKGNCGLDGVVEGYKLNKHICSAATTIIDFNKGKYVFVENDREGDTNVALPLVDNVALALEIGTTNGPTLSVVDSIADFAVELTIVAKSGSKFFSIVARNHFKTDNSRYPYLINNNGGYNDAIGMAGGDTLKLLLVYSGKRYEAYIISHRE